MTKLLRFLPEQCEDVKQGRKTMTRRPVLPQPCHAVYEYFTTDGDADFWSWGSGKAEFCPYGAVGDVVPLAQPNDHVFAKGEITSLAVEVIQAISEADCIAEGCPPEYLLGRNWFFPLWDSIYEPKDLEASSNPWVWVVGFKVVG